MHPSALSVSALRLSEHSVNSLLATLSVLSHNRCNMGIYRVQARLLLHLRKACEACRLAAYFLIVVLILKAAHLAGLAHRRSLQTPVPCACG